MVCLVLVLLCGVPFLVAHPSNQPADTTSPDQRHLLRQIGTLGLLVGAVEVEAAIEARLEHLLKELEQSRPQDVTRRLATIDRTLERAQLSLEILGAGLDLTAADTRRIPSAQLQLRRELQKRAQQVLGRRSRAVARVGNGTSTQVKRQVERQLVEMRRQLAPRIERSVRQLEQQMQQKQPGELKLTLTATVGTETIQRLLAQTLPQAGIRLSDLVRNGLQGEKDDAKDDDEREDSGQKGTNELAVSVDGVGEKSESQESEASESSEEGPGGLVGLIAGLSGGDEGSDVGALIGTLSALVTNLFGPGGLDVPGLLGTGTSLIAGLLGGDDNFGKVLGSYVGIAIEGLSGGGADMNGAFFGNFLGALIAALSSDPEDENLPLKPKLFVQNFFSGLEEAKRKEDPNADGEQCCQKGSDLFAFLGNIVSSVVGGVTSLVLNASLGSSGGSSQGSADASGASSAGSSGGGDHPTSTTH
ncbi:AGAP013464-PA-like protein [Anopheles sinensis]|uniref:AGAP013464-PA-like protein n=1 Tax=Anopheles sinensis TaxID=74873 RepID=A0A084VVF4_ANOSI|nr:AGAP013464-PA-like protein [Anopheles sinensis]